MVCTNCLLTTCKVYKFREMALKSNLLLRQKRKQTKLSTNQHNKLNTQKLHDDNDQFYTVETTDDVDDVEYVTVIVAKEEEESEDETMECLIDGSNEIEIIQSEEYIGNDDTTTGSGIEEIPKMSIAKHRGRKRSDETSDRTLTCNECGKTLSNFSSFKYHMQLHSDKTPFLCSECGDSFKTRNAYDGHMTTHLQSNPNQCNLCGKTYRQAASLRCHLLTHSGDKVNILLFSLIIDRMVLKIKFFFFSLSHAQSVEKV